uniref:Aldehyde reductase 4 n=1 Tax=Streltzoviella insularis TaxID=1206366 RepID=A0A7D5YV71_9NEOP|nr:aldehyde reductase 4 [Streltzoviella insularis]
MALLWFVLTIFIANTMCADEIDGKAPIILLNDGNAIPAIGIGTFLGFDENGQKDPAENEVENAVKWALNAGYRMIDTAAAYRNEDLVGLGIRQSGVPRDNVFIVTKLASTEQRRVIPALRDSLARLNTSYVDLYLIHNPVAFTPDHSAYDIIDYLDTWKSMEEAKELGLAKSIGISNFNISQIERLLANCKVKPSVLQVEVNLNLAQNNLLEFCKRNDIVVMAYSPFGSLFDKTDVPPPPRADDSTLVAFAQKYKKTTPQIVLKYLVQRGLVPIPKSVHKERIEENIDIFDFELTPEEMKTLGKFNKNYRVVWPNFWQDHPYYPFERKDVPDPDPFKGKKQGN